MLFEEAALKLLIKTVCSKKTEKKKIVQGKTYDNSRIKRIGI